MANRGRAVISLGAWLLYYAAAKSVTLAQMTTLYFSAPIIVTILSAILLKERTSLLRWGIVLLGFLGVVVASQPTGAISISSTLMILGAAVLWAYGLVLLRGQSAMASVLEQLVLTNIVYFILIIPAVPAYWSITSVFDPLIMMSVGLIGGMAQYLVFASYKHAPASILAPFEYTGLIWAFILSWVIWGDIPSIALIIGAILIAISGIAGLFAAFRHR